VEKKLSGPLHWQLIRTIGKGWTVDHMKFMAEVVKMNAYRGNLYCNSAFFHKETFKEIDIDKLGSVSFSPHDIVVTRFIVLLRDQMMDRRRPIWVSERWVRLIALDPLRAPPPLDLYPRRTCPLRQQSGWRYTFLLWNFRLMIALILASRMCIKYVSS